MTQQEHDELNAWLAINLFGWKWFKYKPEVDHDYSGARTLTDKPHRYLVASNGKELLAPDAYYSVPKYTTTADALQVLKKCIANSEGFQIQLDGNQVSWGKNGLGANAPTLELSICLFAKKLFSK